MTTTKMLGYLNFSRAIENYIWIAPRAIVAKIITAQTECNINKSVVQEYNVV